MGNRGGLCECGCGQRVRRGSHFLKGHNMKIKEPSGPPQCAECGAVLRRWDQFHPYEACIEVKRLEAAARAHPTLAPPTKSVSVA